MLLLLLGNLGMGGGGAVVPEAEVVVKTGTGGIDPGDGLRRRRIVKPTGLEQRRGTLHLPKKSPTPDERIEDARALQAEVAAQLATEFSADNVERTARAIIPPVATMALTDIEAEIAMLLRKKLRTEDDDMTILLLMAAAGTA